MDSPLVTVVIVTYNSSCTIIETLDSIYNQTYENIELIVSDDNSTDDTIEISEAWIQQKKERFNNVVLVSSKQNTGISANLNRAINVANGIWIKSLAGDDLLLNNCIEECVNFLQNNGGKICMVKLQLFDGCEKKNRKVEQWLEKDKYACLKLTSRKKQYKKALDRHILPGPGIFYTKELWDKIGGFDESYRDFEEYSFELRVLELERVYFLDKPLVKWRQREGSLTHTKASPATLNDINFFFDVRKQLIKQNHYYFLLWDRYINYYAKRKVVCENKSIYYKALALLSPIFYLRKMRIYL